MAEDRYFEPELELLPRAEIQALQEHKILELVPYAYEHSALYRTVWDEAGVHPRDIRTMDDFRARIPFITKDTVRAFRDKHDDAFGGLLCVDRSELTAIMSSSGTTGDATFFPERFARWAPLGTGYVRDLWEHGLRPGDHVIGPAATFRGNSMEDMRQLGCVAVAIDAWLGTWEKVLDAIERYEVRYVQFLAAIVSEIEGIAEHRDMRKALASVKFASFSGEPLGSRPKARIRDEWDTPLAMWTSAGDTGTAWECRENNGYHLWEDTVVPEVVDSDTWAPVAEGEVGEFVVTDIDNRVAPLIRFRTEDLVRHTGERCGCGRCHTRMWPLGRIGDRMVVRGQVVTPVDVWAVIEREDETRSALFQIVRPQQDLDELRIRVGYAPERTASTDDLRERLTTRVESAVGVAPVLEFVEEQQIIARALSPGKIPRVVKA